MELIKKLCKISLMELRKIFSSFFQNDVIVLEPKLFF